MTGKLLSAALGWIAGVVVLIIAIIVIWKLVTFLKRHLPPEPEKAPAGLLHKWDV